MTNLISLKGYLSSYRWKLFWFLFRFLIKRESRREKKKWIQMDELWTMIFHHRNSISTIHRLRATDCECSKNELFRANNDASYIRDMFMFYVMVVRFFLNQIKWYIISNSTTKSSVKLWKFQDDLAPMFSSVSHICCFVYQCDFIRFNHQLMLFSSQY